MLFQINRWWYCTLFWYGRNCNIFYEEKDIKTDIELSACSPEKDEKHDTR
jgi:hypothetical protein